MKHKFEEYFQLPWSIKHREVCYEMGVVENFIYLDLNGDGSEHASEKIPSLIDFTARRDNVDFDKYDVDNAREDALKYLVQCANLMPEAARLLRSADEKLLDLCCTCVNAMTEAGYFVDCKNCNVESLDTSIRALLAKLEGGAEE